MTTGVTNGEQQETKRIVVTGCSPRFSGRQGKVEFTIYDVTATKPGGEAISVPLRSFEDLPLEEMDVTVTKYNARDGITYTLGRVGAQRATRTRIAALEKRVAELEVLLGLNQEAT